MFVQPIPTGFRTTESLDVAVAAANARSIASDADMRVEFHKRGLFTEDLREDYAFVRDVPIDVIRDRVLHARAAETRREAEASRAASSLVASVVEAVATPVVVSAPAPAPVPVVKAARAPAPAPLSSRPPAPSVRPPAPQPQEEHVKCVHPGCQIHGLPRHMRVPSVRRMEAIHGRLPTEEEVRQRITCRGHERGETFPVDTTLTLLKKLRAREGQAESGAKGKGGFGTLGDLFGAKLRR